jgi:hypothetical protein
MAFRPGSFPCYLKDPLIRFSTIQIKRCKKKYQRHPQFIVTINGLGHKFFRLEQVSIV